MGRIVAPEGLPLAAAVIGTADPGAALGFYRGEIGLEVLAEADLAGTEAERFWRGSRGRPVHATLLGAGPDPVGRLMLVELEEAPEAPLRRPGEHTGYGLLNLNFYSRDIRADTARFRSLGYRFWSEPVRHSFSPGVGAPIEVILDGPDAVPINLVELATGDPATRIGQMRAWVEDYGRTPRGFTPVVTTAHNVRGLEASLPFHRRVLGQGELIDEVLESDEANGFLGLEPGSRTHVVFMQGGHMFGKIVLSEPLNYGCPDLAARADGAAVGYFAQQFLTPDLGLAAAEAAALGANRLAGPVELELPGWGRCLAAAFAHPGSGARQELLQPCA
jgi:catechol 2,3-dioxygenase-like lactoylglutathione lyase family enzyme